MTFIDKVTGKDLTREYQQLNSRIEVLPQEYQQAWEQILVRLNMRSDFSGRNLIPLCKGVVDMLEEMNIEGRTIEQIFGGNIEQFCNELAIGEPSLDVRDKWRKQLNNKIEKRFK